MPRGLKGAFLLLPVLIGCQGAFRAAKPPPLGAEGEVWVYLAPVPPQLERLEFTVTSVALGGEGAGVPLGLVLPEVSGKLARRERLLAVGRVPPGAYGGLTVQVGRASIAGGDGKANLLAPVAPVRVAVPLNAVRGRAVVVSLALQAVSSVEKGFGFNPAFTALVPDFPLAERLAFVSDTGSDSVTVFDRRTRRVAAVIPTGREPQGLAVDPRLGRLYVALAGEDQVAAHDLQTGAEVGRIRLQPGDEPVEVAVTPDGRLLVTANRRSSTASFLDPQALMEVDRAPTGLQPSSLLMDRAGRRAYAFNRGSSSVTVLDLATRKAVTSLRTEPEPLRGTLSRAGDRLYVASGLSPYLATYAVPALTPLQRTYVGPGASALLVDPRTDFVYVAKGPERRIQIYEPSTFLPVAELPAEGAVTWMSLDVPENVLLAVVPEANSVAVFELNARRALPGVDVGNEPYAAAVVGERN
jgi:YVTN family beta-propeller protein